MFSSAFVIAQDDDFADEEEPQLFKKKESKFKLENLRVGFLPEFAIGRDQFNQGVMLLGLNANASYRIKDRFEPGVGFFYNYINYTGKKGIHNHAFGGFQDAKLYIWNNIFAYQRALLASSSVIIASLDQFGNLRYEVGDRLSYGNLFLGGGYDFEIGANAEFSLMVMTNLFLNDAYPKRDIIVSMRFSFGLGGGARVQE